MADLDPLVLHYNTRIHAMKSRLLAKTELEEMLERNDLSHLSDVLLESPYRKEMAEALTRFEGAGAIEDAVSRNLVETFEALIDRAQGDFKQLVQAFLTRWDLSAAKSLLRCRHHQLDGASARAALIPGPTLTVAVLQDLAKLDSMEALVHGLAGWNAKLGRRLIGQLEAYRDGQDLLPLEEALDRAYFVDGARALRNAQGEDAGMVRDLLRLEIDRINLRTLFQHLQAASQGDQGGTDGGFAARLLPQGALPLSLLQAMAAAGDVAGAMEQLSGTRYRELVEEMFQLMQTHRFSPVERFFERLMMKHIRRRALGSVFGIGVFMDYAWLKYNEAINLRLIARGVAGHLPAGRVREELYFV